MTSNSLGAENLPLDVWRVIFEQLVGDYETLCNIGLTCYAWRSLSLPCLLQWTDLSSHNNGRVPEHECEILPVLYADFHAKYRPPNLVPRQRAFLRLMTERPELAKYVKKFEWTLVWANTWKNSDDDSLTAIDRGTWNVFSRLTNVTELDLASLHDIWEDDFVRKNPDHLFPAVTRLRLVGWMHRGLVKAILRSINASKLRKIEFDYLEDQGTLPNDVPLNWELAEEFAPNSKRTDRTAIVSDELYRRQESGDACIFPGPMWLPMRLLSASSLDSLTYLEVRLAPFEEIVDLRNYHTYFHETANMISKARQSLRTLIVAFEESHQFYKDYEHYPRGGCRFWQQYCGSTYRPRCIEMAMAFLNRCFAALRQGPYPDLREVRLEGFHVLITPNPLGPPATAPLEDIFRSVRDLPFENTTFSQTRMIDHRDVFLGFDCAVPDIKRLDELMRNS